MKDTKTKIYQHFLDSLVFAESNGVDLSEVRNLYEQAVEFYKNFLRDA